MIIKIDQKIVFIAGFLTHIMQAGKEPYTDTASFIRTQQPLRSDSLGRIMSSFFDKDTWQNMHKFFGISLCIQPIEFIMTLQMTGK